MAKVEVTTIVDNDASAARIDVEILGSNELFWATGSAKKHPKDPSVVVVGEALALSRAFREIADELEDYAMDTNSKHLENLRMEKVLASLHNQGFNL